MTPAELQQTLAQAMEDQRAGRLVEAAQGYQAVLAHDPQHPAARNLLAVVNKTVESKAAAKPPSSTQTDADTQRGDAEVERLREAIVRQPDQPEALMGLAVALVNLIRREDDETFNTLDRNRTSIPAMNAIGQNLPRHRRFLDEALAALERALTVRPDLPHASYLQGECLMIAGEEQRAAAAFARAAAAGHQEGRYRLATLGGEQVDIVPSSVVTRMFDANARRYDDEMRNIECDVPAQLVEILSAAAGADARFQFAVDLGCGTGRCGVLFRNRTQRLVGIDLSPQMLAEAEKRRVYDALHAEDLITGLARCQGCDLALAADVFVYIGHLEPVFAAIAAALTPGAWLLLSTEKLAQGDYQILPTGRFAQSEAYIRRLADAHGFEVVVVREVNVRLDLRGPIPGQTFALRRLTADAGAVRP